jgi:hypothetical protein
LRARNPFEKDKIEYNSDEDQPWEKQFKIVESERADGQTCNIKEPEEYVLTNR